VWLALAAAVSHLDGAFLHARNATSESARRNFEVAITVDDLPPFEE
jgi:hypothetical protein